MLGFYLTFLNYQGQNYINSLTHDAFVGTIEIIPTAGTNEVTAPTTVKVRTAPNSNDNSLVANDWRATDWAAISAFDTATGVGDEYTAISPLAYVKCDEEWTLDTPSGAPTQGPDIKCVRHTVVYTGPMNKAGTSLTTKEDVDITYRKIAIGAGWQLYK